MSNQEILEKAMLAAIDGGWWTSITDFKVHEALDVTIWTDDLSNLYNLEAVIFDQDFAKALWGEKRGRAPLMSEDGLEINLIMKAWHYHLQQMVIADDPIKYLGENI